MRKGCLFTFLMICLSCLLTAASNKDPMSGVQFGALWDDRAEDLAVDDDANIYVVGYTYGNLAQANAGGEDGFINKYDENGRLTWTRQIGTAKNDEIEAITVDKDHNCYIAGSTGGSMGKYTNAGMNDCFVAKLSQDGQLVWLTQFGSVGDDWSLGIVRDDAGNIYMCGYTDGRLGAERFGQEDGFVVKFNGEGTQQWVKQFGTGSNDQLYSLVLDKTGDICIAGFTKGDWAAKNAGNYDNYLMRLNKDGEILGKYQSGTGGEDTWLAIAIDDQGKLYLGGSSNNSASITAMDKNGVVLWSRQFGTGNWSGTWEVIVFPDGSGDILVGGCQNYATCQAFMRRYTKDGALVWENVAYKDERKSTCGRKVAIDDEGNCYQVGYTTDNLFTKSIGDSDAYWRKIGGEK